MKCECGSTITTGNTKKTKDAHGYDIITRYKICNNCKLRLISVERVTRAYVNPEELDLYCKMHNIDSK